MLLARREFTFSNQESYLLDLKKMPDLLKLCKLCKLCFKL